MKVVGGGAGGHYLWQEVDGTDSDLPRLGEHGKNRRSSGLRHVEAPADFRRCDLASLLRQAMKNVGVEVAPEVD